MKQPPRRTLRILQNALTGWVAMAASAVIGFFLVPFLIRELGREAYGLIGIVAALISFTTLADFGIRDSLGRHLAEHSAREDIDGFNRVLNTSLVIYVSIASVSILTCFWLAEHIARTFHVSPSLFGSAVGLIRWYGGATIAIGFVQPVFTAAITSRNRFDVVNMLEMSASLGTGILLFIVLRFDVQVLFAWALISVSCRLIILVASMCMAARYAEGLRLSVFYFKPEAVWSLLSLGGYMYVFQMANILSIKADPLIIGTTLGTSMVALYTAGAVLPGRARPFVQTLVNQLHPVTTSSYVGGREDELRQVLVRGTRYTLLMGIPVSVILAGLAFPLTKLWLGGTLGEDYRWPAMVMMCWTIVDLTHYAAGSQWPVLLGMKRIRFLALIQLPTAILNVFTSYMLVRYTNLGLLGVMVPSIVFGLVRRPIVIVHAAHACGMTAKHYWRDAYLQPLLVLFMLSCCTGLFLCLINPDSWLAMGVLVLVIGLFWAVLTWFIGFSANDRRLFEELFADMLTRLRVVGQKPSESL